MTKLDRLRAACLAVFFGGMFLFWPLNALLLRPNTEAFYVVNITLLLVWGALGTALSVLWGFYQCPACLKPFFRLFPRGATFSNTCARCGYQLPKD